MPVLGLFGFAVILATIPGPAPVVIYGQDALYAARGQDARSRPAKAGIHVKKGITGPALTHPRGGSNQGATRNSHLTTTNINLPAPTRFGGRRNPRLARNLNLPPGFQLNHPARALFRGRVQRRPY